MSDVIFALASAKGKAGVAVIRLSGPAAIEVAESFVGPGLPQAGRSLRDFRDDGDFIDQVLVLTFAKGASFTGEQVVELHCHGSMAVIAALLRCLSNHSNAVLAEPGAFTRKALENGCLDLAQVEGLADLIDAETQSQHRLAARVFAGGLSDKVNQWRQDLIRAASLIEATIDFADEDVPTDVGPEVTDLISTTQKALSAEIAGTHAAERIRDGFEVAILGRPNVGKSTLLNALAGRKAAITSELAGTTRDVIEVRMDIGGLAVTLLDTAGLREATDQIETLGIALARDRAEGADLRIFLTTDGKVDDLGVAPQPGDIISIAKGDLNPVIKGLHLSGLSGLGLDELITRISDTLSDRASGAQTATRERHRIGMTRAQTALSAAKDQLALGPDAAEFAAAELREALTALNSLIGKVDVEDLLDEIFASFCLGK